MAGSLSAGVDKPALLASAKIFKKTIEERL
jgi:hypothetical protein